MELTMANGLFELSQHEMLEIDGGIDWESVAAGLGIASATFIAIACAPASAFVGAAYGGMLISGALGGASAGAYIGYGLAN